MNKLTTPKLVELVQQHHPNVPVTTIIQALNTAQTEFVRKTKFNVIISSVDTDSQTVVGETYASPLNLTDSTSSYTWQFYKDDTVPTVALKKNTNVIYILRITGHDEDGNLATDYAFETREDGSLLLYDENGAALDDFEGNTDYINIMFAKVPSQLVASSTSSPDIDGEFHSGLADCAIGYFYGIRSDLQVQERLMMSKHYKNLWQETLVAGKMAYNKAYSDVPVSAQAVEEFQSE